MILRRISDNLKSQNWAGLSLELLVLVAGVFIGLQVDDWNESRKDRAQELVYLEKLKADAVQSLVIIDNWQENSDLTQSHARWFIEYDGTDITDLEEKEFFYRINRVLFSIDPLTLQRTTINELMSIGGIAVLDSAEIREKILDIELANQVLERRQDDKYDIFVNNIDPYMINTYDSRNHVRITRQDDAFDRDIEAPETSLTIRMAMMNDMKLRNMALYRNGIQTLVENTVQRIEDSYRELIILLDARIAELS